MAHVLKTSSSASTLSMIFLSCFVVALPVSMQADDTCGPINSEDQAVTVAQELVGMATFPVDTLEKPGVRRVSLETFSDTTIPLVEQSIRGHTAWKVSFGGFESTLSRVEGVENPIEFPRVCDVWLDSLGGNLLRIEIFSLSSDHPFDVPPTKEQMESEARTNGEKYLGLPIVHPEITAIEALALGGRFVVRYIPKAPRIVLRYVTMSSEFVDAENEFPAWLIRLHGVGVDRVSSRSSPIESRATRYIVNALTGESMGRFAVEYNVRQ